MSAFIDTSAIVAYYNSRDQHHAQAVEVLSKAAGGEYGRLFISDYVFDEAVTVTLVRTKDLELAVRLGEVLLNSEVEVLRVDEDAFDLAWRIFREVGLSFTDCTILALMRLYGIPTLITFDRGFAGMGVRMVP
ncbi:MAG: type II toxin-antitoxin system VapC family toxin [Euryarchaeota archaeon]|nr:type II toxin-antitoxin system VapC family toxin [Euryarchaeota archaeon]